MGSVVKATWDNVTSRPIRETLALGEDKPACCERRKR